VKKDSASNQTYEQAMKISSEKKGEETGEQVAHEDNELGDEHFMYLKYVSKPEMDELYKELCKYNRRIAGDDTRCVSIFKFFYLLFLRILLYNSNN
jgi:hypothetical protein